MLFVRYSNDRETASTGKIWNFVVYILFFVFSRRRVSVEIAAAAAVDKTVLGRNDNGPAVITTASRV